MGWAFPMRVSSFKCSACNVRWTSTVRATCSRLLIKLFLFVEKVLWWATDCWPVNEAKELFDHYADHGIVYEVSIPGAKVRKLKKSKNAVVLFNILFFSIV